MARPNRIRVSLECSKCKSRNYRTDKNLVTSMKRLELNKFCKRCGGRTLHKETK